MNASVSLNQSGNRLIGIDVFDVDRQTLLRSLREFLVDPLIPADIKRDEVKSTMLAVRSMAILSGVVVDA